MKRKIPFIIIISVLAAAILLCSCGASDSSSYSGKMTEETGNSMPGWNAVADMDSTEMIVSDALPEESVDAPSSAGSSELPAQYDESERKIIKHKDISVETVEYDEFTSELTRLVDEYGGYIQASTQNGSSYYGSSLRSSKYTIRIPAERFDEFTSVIGDLATVTYSYEYIDDVTEQYVDIEARLAALRAEQESFLNLMEKAQTIEEILQIQSYLTDVNYQFAPYTSRMKPYDSLIAYSTLTLDVTEVERIVPPSATNPSVFEQIKTNLSENLYNIGQDFKNMFVNIVSSLPYIGIFAVTVGIIAIIVVVIVKKVKRSQAKAAQVTAESCVPSAPQPAQQAQAENAENKDKK